MESTSEVRLFNTRIGYAEMTMFNVYILSTEYNAKLSFFYPNIQPTERFHFGKNFDLQLLISFLSPLDCYYFEQ